MGCSPAPQPFQKLSTDTASACSVAWGENGGACPRTPAVLQGFGVLNRSEPGGSQPSLWSSEAQRAEGKRLGGVGGLVPSSQCSESEGGRPLWGQQVPCERLFVARPQGAEGCPPGTVDSSQLSLISRFRSLLPPGGLTETSRPIPSTAVTSTGPVLGVRLLSSCVSEGPGASLHAPLYLRAPGVPVFPGLGPPGARQVPVLQPGGGWRQRGTRGKCILGKPPPGPPRMQRTEKVPGRRGRRSRGAPRAAGRRWNQTRGRGRGRGPEAPSRPRRRSAQAHCPRAARRAAIRILCRSVSAAAAPRPPPPPPPAPSPGPRGAMLPGRRR